MGADTTPKSPLPVITPLVLPQGPLPEAGCGDQTTTASVQRDSTEVIRDSGHWAEKLINRRFSVLIRFSNLKKSNFLSNLYRYGKSCFISFVHFWLVKDYNKIILSSKIRLLLTIIRQRPLPPFLFNVLKLHLFLLNTITTQVESYFWLNLVEFILN